MITLFDYVDCWFRAKINCIFIDIIDYATLWLDGN